MCHQDRRSTSKYCRNCRVDVHLDCQLKSLANVVHGGRGRAGAGDHDGLRLGDLPLPSSAEIPKLYLFFQVGSTGFTNTVHEPLKGESDPPSHRRPDVL